MNKETLSIDQFHIPRWNEIPNVGLYLEQVVTLINSSFSKYIDFQDDYKHENNPILTKTMINNYVKNQLIDAPTRKLYSRLQIAKLFVICILKQVYSMSEIKVLIKIALKFGTDDETYNNFCDLFEEALYCTYNKKDFIDPNSSNNSLYLMKSILLSCSYKIYVQNYISKRSKIK